jgi:hypothetical protein
MPRSTNVWKHESEDAAAAAAAFMSSTPAGSKRNCQVRRRMGVLVVPFVCTSVTAQYLLHSLYPIAVPGVRSDGTSSCPELDLCRSNGIAANFRREDVIDVFIDSVSSAFAHERCHGRIMVAAPQKNRRWLRRGKSNTSYSNHNLLCESHGAKRGTQ